MPKGGACFSEAYCISQARLVGCSTSATERLVLWTSTETPRWHSSLRIALIMCLSVWGGFSSCFLGFGFGFFFGFLVFFGARVKLHMDWIGDGDRHISDEHARVSVNLQRATLVILCESVYDPRTEGQIPKRAHRLGNTHQVWYYAMPSDTMIEDTLDAKRRAKFGFTAKAFMTENEGAEGSTGLVHAWRRL